MGLGLTEQGVWITRGCPHTGSCSTRNGDIVEIWERESFPQWENENAGVGKSKETPKLNKHEEEQTEHSGCRLGGRGQKHGLGLGQNGPGLSPSSHRQWGVIEGFE